MSERQKKTVQSYRNNWDLIWGKANPVIEITNPMVETKIERPTIDPLTGTPLPRPKWRGNQVTK